MTESRRAPRLTLRFSLRRDNFAVEIDRTLDLSDSTAVYGPSGSGKTSLLRVIAGLERATAGYVEFGGECWQEELHWVPPHRRRVGFVFQEARLFPHLDVAGNLELARRAHKGGGDLKHTDIVAALEIGHLLDRSTTTLSGGETQRVAIARTLFSQPRLLLMDEPVSSLDSVSRRETIEYIARLTESLDLPLIYVTHDAAEVARLAEKTLLLGNGQVLAYGRTPDVFAAMETRVAGGDTASILEASVVGVSEGLTTMHIGEQTLRLAMDGRDVGATAQLRILAKDVVIATRRIDDTSIRNVLRGEVIAVSALDAGTVEVRISLANQVLKAHVTRIAVDELGLVTGSSVYAMIKSVALGTTIWDKTE